jgi:hypothetical protein
MQIVCIEPGDKRAAGGTKSLSNRIGWTGIAATHQTKAPIDGG